MTAEEDVAAVRRVIANDPYPPHLFPSYQDHDYVKGWRAAMATVARCIEEDS